MGNKDSKATPEDKTTPYLDSSESEDESCEAVFPLDPDIKKVAVSGDGSSGAESRNQRPAPSTSRSKSRPPKKSTKALSNPVRSFREFLDSCNAIPDYNSVATIEYARKFIHDGFSKCSGDDLSACLAMLLEYFYKSFEKINMYRDIFYLIYKDSRYTHYSSRVFSAEFEKVFQHEKSKISENSKWDEIVMFGALLCELLTIYQADTFLVTKQLSNWTMELIRVALDGNDNGLIAYMLILKKLSTTKFPLKERFDHDLGVLKILLRDGNAESKTQDIYSYLEQRRLSQLADYQCLEESIYSEETANSDKCREFEIFLNSDSEILSFDINLLYDITDNELEFFARKFIEVGIVKPQRIKFLAFTAYKFQNVLNVIRKIINLVVKHLEKEIEEMRLQKNRKNSIPIINFAKFIAELYVNEKKIISPIMMTSWLSLMTELGESTAIATTLKICGYFYKIDEPENFDKFMDSISIFWTIVNDEMANISEQLNGKGQEVYGDYLESRMYQPAPSVPFLDDLYMMLFEISRSQNFNFNFQCLLEFRTYEMYNTARAIITEVSKPNAKVIKLAEFLKSFFTYSFKIGKFVKRLKINFESRIAEMTLDNPEEIKNVGKLIGELRNYTVIDKVPQDKWLEMIESFNGLKNPNIIEIQLEVLKVMLQNLLIHDEDRYMEYLKDIKAIDTADPQTTLKVKSLILQITQNFVSKKIDKSSRDILFRIKIGIKIEGLPGDLPASSPTVFDLHDFVNTFMLQTISNRFLIEFYTSSLKNLRNGRNNDFVKILLDLCKDRFKTMLNPELFDEDDAIGSLKLIKYLFKTSILTDENNEAFLRQMLEFENFKEHKSCLKILFGIIKNVVIFSTGKQDKSNKNLKALLRKVEAKLSGSEESNPEDQEEVEVWHIVDYQGYTNEKSLLESETIDPNHLAWSFTENYQQDKARNLIISEKAKTQNASDSKPFNLFNQQPERSKVTVQKLQNALQNAAPRNNRSAFKTDKKSNKGNWNVTRDDLKHRNDLGNQELPAMKKRFDQNSYLYQSERQNGAEPVNNRNSRRGRAENWKQNSQEQKTGYVPPHLRGNRSEDSGNISRQNGRQAAQKDQNLQKKKGANSKETSNSQKRNQNGSKQQNGLSGPANLKNEEIKKSQIQLNSEQDSLKASKLNVSLEKQQESNQIKENSSKADQQTQKTDQNDQKATFFDKSAPKPTQNAQALIQKDQIVQKPAVATQKGPSYASGKDNSSDSSQSSKIDNKSNITDQKVDVLSPKSGTSSPNAQILTPIAQNSSQKAENSQQISKNSSQKTQNPNQKAQNLNQKSENLNQTAPKSPTNVQKLPQKSSPDQASQSTTKTDQKTENQQNSSKIAPKSSQNVRPNQPAPYQAPNVPQNFTQLPPKLAPAEMIATYNQTIFLISSNIENFKKCAILIHGWGLGNPEMQAGIKELTTLIKKELLLNHKQLLAEMAADLSRECDQIRRKLEVQQKNIFITTVKAVMPFLVKCALYNMLDDLVGQINNGNKVALALFSDLTEGMKEFLTEDCRERDQFVPNCVKVLERAKNFKCDEATRARTFEIFKFFKGQKINTANNWRDNSNSRMQNAGSLQSISSSNNSGGRSRRRRQVYWNQNNQGHQATRGNSEGGTSKLGAGQKSGKLTSKSDSNNKLNNITSKKISVQKSDNQTSKTNSVLQNLGNINSKVDNKTSKSDVAQKPAHITSKNDTEPSKSALNPSNSQKAIASPPENYKIDEKINFYINQLNPTNLADIKVKITPFLNKDFKTQNVLDAMLDKGVSDQKYACPITDLFGFIFKQNQFKDTKKMMADKIVNRLLYVCEKENKTGQIMVNFAKFIRAFEPFLMNSIIFRLWLELIEFVRHDTPNVLETLIFMMTDRLELFYQTTGREQHIDKFVKIFKEKLKSIKDKELKLKIENIIKTLEGGEASRKQKNGPKSVNKVSESQKQVEKDSETPAQKTKNLAKLFGVGDDDGDSDLFYKIKSQLQNSDTSHSDQMGNICTKFEPKLDKDDQKLGKSGQEGQGAVENIQKSAKDDQNSVKIDQHPGKFSDIDVKSSAQVNTESTALKDIQQKLQQISIQNVSPFSQTEQTPKVSGPEVAPASESLENKQAKLIQGLTKQLGSLDIEDESVKDKQPGLLDNKMKDNQDEPLKANKLNIKAAKLGSTKPNDASNSKVASNAFNNPSASNSAPTKLPEPAISSSTPTDQPEPVASTQPSKKSSHPHPDDKIRPLIFTSDYILFDQLVENRRKFAEILKFMCSVSDENKDSVEVRENIAKALIKLNYLKIRADSDDFYDFAEVFFQLYTKPEQRSFNKFVMLKFLMAWKFYEENVEGDEEVLGVKIYERFSKSICRIKKSFVVSSEEPMEGTKDGNITSKWATSKLQSASSSELDQGNSLRSLYFSTFMSHLTSMLTTFLTGHVTSEREYNKETIRARRTNISELICDLYLHGTATDDFILGAVTKLLESSENEPEKFNFLAQIIKNVGAILEIRQKKKFDEILRALSTKIHENPGKVAEIFETRKSRYVSVENFTPIFLLFHENPAKFFGFIETLWKRLMENPENVAELSEIVEELLENLGEKFAFLMSEFMENRRISFEKIPVEMFSKIVCQRLKGSILFSFELFEMQILIPERFAGWFKDEVYGKLGNDEKEEISRKLMKRGVEIGKDLTENLKEQFEKFNTF